MVGYEFFLEVCEFVNVSNNIFVLVEFYWLEGLILDFFGEYVNVLEVLNCFLELYNKV